MRTCWLSTVLGLPILFLYTPHPLSKTSYHSQKKKTRPYNLACYIVLSLLYLAIFPLGSKQRGQGRTQGQWALVLRLNPGKVPRGPLDSSDGLSSSYF